MPSIGRKVLPAVILLATGVSPAAADGKAELTAFLETHRCEVVLRLEQIRDAKTPKGKPHSKDRFLILSSATMRERYVQCIFIEAGARMLCEAANGFYATHLGKDAATVLPPAGALALQELGFPSTGNDGNLQRFIPTRVPKDLIAVADLMLTALYKGYNLRPDSKIDMDAPLAPGRVNSSSRCSPLS